MKRAKNCSMKVGVRSGGHLFSCASLVENGLLIDTKNLNKDFVFDPQTKIISFSPGHTVEELANHLVPLKRFFPYGHSRTVGAGGFYLAGGQGCFLRGWGYTCDTWVTQIEVVTADGDVVIANDTANQDLFWAAGGGGLGFFGVLTRIWGRTIPAQKLYDTTIILDTTSIAKPLLEWILYTADKIPRYGSDIFVATFYSDMENEDGGDFSKTKKVFLAINQTMMADTIEQAKVLSSPWDTLPKIFQSNMITKVPLLERTWEDLWNVQEKFQPHGKGERYRVDSILADPGVPYKKVCARICPKEIV